MKKIILSTVAVASLTVSSFAESSNSKYYFGIGTFVGLSGTHTQDRIVDYYSSSSSDYSKSYDTDLEDGKAISIKFGAKSNNSRFEVGYTSISFDDDISFAGTNESYKAEFTGFDLDWVRPFGDSVFKPYVTLGMALYSWTDLEIKQSDGSTSERTAFGFNYGAGLLYSLGSIEFDLAYKGKGLIWKDIRGKYSNGTADYSDFTSLNGLYAGINIHF